ncbi:MAG: SUMF1/EgtB/PvdO family nonheme iron enzyme [Phycisphaerales bacterium]|nr:MAG: SUMF1/EgtB/PvdO family nonheme iron enzyme [Phycisphaerales bacterium]
MKVTCLGLTVALLLASPSFASGDDRDSEMRDMLFVEGGTFEMGDVFDEGVQFAEPVHQVTLTGYYMNKHEVTVEEFALFVKETGYVTSAEPASTPEGGMRRSPRAPGAREPTGHLARPGAWVLRGDDGSGEPNSTWEPDATWRNVHYQQDRRHPVTSVSWKDAVSYCNWLSVKEGLPVAYNVETGELLDAHGSPTTDITKVKGYRLPTEAEWEYAARERGKKVRFGNGRNTARSSEMNFNAAGGSFVYAEVGEYRGRTTPVGTFKPNNQGLHDMSGNVWEWCSDFLGKYKPGPQTNPYQTEGMMGPRRAARGGPWVGDASWARVATRIGWTSEDRCNNIGFRLARSK